MAFLSREQIDAMGFSYVGENVCLSDKASYYNCKNISIGSNSRIDDFCVLSAGAGGISIGNYVHVAVYSSLIGAGRISVGDYCSLSSRTAVYSSNDDYSGAYMVGPTVPSRFTNVTHAAVEIGKHVIVGSGSVILPGVLVEDGVAIGALSLISKNCDAYGVYVGAPAKRIKERKTGFLEMELKLLSENGTHDK